jgi:hypothetical protein
MENAPAEATLPFLTLTPITETTVPNLPSVYVQITWNKQTVEKKNIYGFFSTPQHLRKNQYHQTPEENAIVGPELDKNFAVE